MNGLALNLILALVWALFLGEVSLRSLSLGFVLGFLVLRLFWRSLGAAAYIRAVTGVMRLLLYFVWELVRANFVMARLALKSHPQLNQMIVGVPLELQGEGSLTLLAALTGLMPGTVTLGFSEHKDVMYVHATGMQQRSEVVASVKNIEQRMLGVLGLGVS